MREHAEDGLATRRCEALRRVVSAEPSLLPIVAGAGRRGVELRNSDGLAHGRRKPWRVLRRSGTCHRDGCGSKDSRVAPPGPLHLLRPREQGQSGPQARPMDDDTLGTMKGPPLSTTARSRRSA